MFKLAKPGPPIWLNMKLTPQQSFDFAYNYGKVSEGFLTNLNRFVDREEAYIIALNAKQIDSRINGSALYSEDLY